ncbi:MAG: hypothetical protein WBG41_06740 [Acidimicrobiales bacterium]
MTKFAEGPRCGWCHRPIDQRPGAGRPRQFCSASHRQRAFEARRRAASFRLPDGQSVVADHDLRRLHDRLYRLEAAVVDVTADVAGGGRHPDYHGALEHLLDAAEDLVGQFIEPVRQ